MEEKRNPVRLEKGCLVSEIREGQNVEGLFLIKEVTRAETRTGNPYLVLVVVDRSGEISGRVWEEADKWLAECQPGEVVSLSGLAQAYKGVTQLRVSRVKAVARTEVPMEQFIPTTRGDIAAMRQEIVTMAGSVENRFLRRLLLRFFRPGDFFELFAKAPAATKMHHAYVGGLLEHTLAVARLANMVSKSYRHLDRSLLLAGALLHDVGKVAELDCTSYPFFYTDRGRLVGHMVLGVDMVQAHVDKIKDFPEETAIWLKHMILSHHGYHEFGSPSVPMMIEAFVLHFLDDLDAKVNYVDRLGQAMKEPGYQWTDYQKNLERYLLVMGRDPEDDGPSPGTKGDASAPAAIRQKSLWEQ